MTNFRIQTAIIIIFFASLMIECLADPVAAQTATLPQIAPSDSTAGGDYKELPTWTSEDDARSGYRTLPGEDEALQSLFDQETDSDPTSLAGLFSQENSDMLNTLIGLFNEEESSPPEQQVSDETAQAEEPTPQPDPSAEQQQNDTPAPDDDQPNENGSGAIAGLFGAIGAAVAPQNPAMGAILSAGAAAGGNNDQSTDQPVDQGDCATRMQQINQQSLAMAGDQSNLCTVASANAWEQQQKLQWAQSCASDKVGIVQQEVIEANANKAQACQ